MNFFRTVVTKAACRVAEVCCSTESLIRRKKERMKFHVSTVLHMKENNSCYTEQMKLNISSQQTNFWGCCQYSPVMNTYDSEKAKTNIQLRKTVKRAKDKVLSITVSLSMVNRHHAVPHYPRVGFFTHFKKYTELEDVKGQRQLTWIFPHRERLIRG